MILIHCCCCCLISSLCQAIRQERPIVNLPTLGQLRGFVAVTTTGRKFHAFRGIPYALPPVGELRFRVGSYSLFIILEFTLRLNNLLLWSNLFLPLLIKDPIPVKPWTGVFNANQEGSPCVQIDCILFKIIGNEDCLKLNVFTPVVRNGESLKMKFTIQKKKVYVRINE